MKRYARLHVVPWWLLALGLTASAAEVVALVLLVVARGR